MKKLHSLAVCALAAPVLVLGAGSVLAQQSTDENVVRGLQIAERDKDATKSRPGSDQAEQGTQHESSMQSRDYIGSAPPSGAHASDLIGANVITGSDEDVGSVSDLIIDENGQVVAIVVGVGGFLGMGEKNVAIGWGQVTRSGSPDDQELRIDATRDDLRSAPEYKQPD